MQYNAMPPTIEWISILPTLIVAATGMLALVPEVINPKRQNGLIIFLSIFGLLVGGAVVIKQWAYPYTETFGGMAIRDPLALTMQLLIIGATILAILFSEGYLREKRIPFGEFYPLVIWSASGAMVMATSRNLLMIFIGLEILSIALYVLAGMSRNEEKSEESALKYFLLGAFASAFLLYGIALVYGATGTIHLEGIGRAWVSADPSTRTLVLFGLGMMLIGLSFKASFVPFHQWTPDVYQGAPTNVTTFMASVSKMGAFAALIRILDATQILKDYWIPAMFWIAILTMTIGNLVALVQKDVKRVLGYSSIAHAGYMLVAILAHYKDPLAVPQLTSLTYYLLSYSLMTIGAFAVVSMLAKNGKETTRMSDLYGLYKRAPWASGLLVLFCVSLIGIPPTSGFVGKFLIFQDALKAGLTPLAIVLAINSVISVYYYLGIMRAVFVADDGSKAGVSPRWNAGLSATMAICSIGVVVAGIGVYSILPYLAVR